MPPFVLVPMPTEGDFFNYQEAYQAAFIGSEYDGMVLADPSKPDFQLLNLNLPKSGEAISDRRAILSTSTDAFAKRRNWLNLQRWMHSRSRRSGCCSTWVP